MAKKERVIVSLEISTAKDAASKPGVLVKGLSFKCLPDDAEELFKMACAAIERERENGESGSTAKKRG